jgi:hypothetical protein
MSNEQKSPAVLGPVQRGVGPLVDRLRRHMETTGVVPFDVMQEAIAEIETLQAHVARIEEWQQKGEKEFRPERTTWHFRLGAWWADRPWRERPNDRGNRPSGAERKGDGQH